MRCIVIRVKVLLIYIYVVREKNVGSLVFCMSLQLRMVNGRWRGWGSGLLEVS